MRIAAVVFISFLILFSLFGTVRRAVLWPYRYAKCTIVYDFGLRESTWIAWEYDDICFH